MALIRRNRLSYSVIQKGKAFVSQEKVIRNLVVNGQGISIPSRVNQIMQTADKGRAELCVLQIWSGEI
jgi:hypothetical protein